MKAVCCPSGNDCLHPLRNAAPLNNIEHYNDGKLNRPWHVPEFRPAGFRIVHFLLGLRTCRIGKAGSWTTGPGGIIRDPKAEPEARILADNPRKPVSRLDVDQKGDAVVITTGKVRIEISKKTSLFKVINLKDHSVVAEQASPILFEKGKTSFSLKAKPDEYFYGESGEPLA